MASSWHAPQSAVDWLGFCMVQRSKFSGAWASGFRSSGGLPDAILCTKQAEFMREPGGRSNFAVQEGKHIDQQALVI